MRCALVLAAALLVVGAVAGLAFPDWARDPRYWWQTPDQLGQALYQQGDAAQAAQHFRMPQWRGTACYRSGDFACAEAAFAQAALMPDGAATAAFNRGNVAAHAGRLADALARYDEALALRPDWRAARANHAVVLAELGARQQRARERAAADEPVLPPDGTVVDDQGKRGKPGRIEVEKLDSDALAALWLRNVRNDPGAFLRLRFAEERRRAEGEQ